MISSDEGDFLKYAELFKELSDEQIDAIAGCADVTWFDKGGALTTVDDWGSAAFLVISGSVMVADATAKSSHQDPLGAGTLVGELAMLTEVTYAATVVAAEPVRALAIDRDALYKVLEADPAIADHICEKLSSRLSRLTDELRAVDESFEALETSLQRAASA